MDAQFRLIAGLGNPGREYEHTRHNLGFLLLDAAAARFGLSSAAASWKRHGEALRCEAVVAGRKLMLVKPQSFMNRSGLPLAEVVNYFDVSADELLVIHDEVDLPFGTLRLKKGGGHGGHNGVLSVHEMIGSAYARLRLGVGKPDTSAMPGYDLADWVLGRLSQAELGELPDFIDRGIDALVLACEKGFARAQSEVNRCPEDTPET